MQDFASMSLTPPEEFCDYCGPRALAAIISPRNRTLEARVDAARVLLDVKSARNNLCSLPSTEPEDLAIALSVYGFAAEPWDSFDFAPPGRTAERFLERANERKARDERPTTLADVREVIERCSSSQHERMWASFRSTHDDKPKLNKWLTKPGTWLFAVTRKNTWSHWVAARDNVVIAGDDGNQHGDLPVFHALRVKGHNA